MIPRQIPIEQLESVMLSVAQQLEKQSFQDVLTQCHALMRENIAENFAAEEDSSGTRWPKRKDQRRRKDGHPLLRLSLSMFDAATQLGAEGSIDQVSGRESLMGISLDAIPYARAQNFGHHYDVNGRQWTLPPREYYWISDETLGRCEDLIAEYALAQVF